MGPTLGFHYLGLRPVFVYLMIIMQWHAYMANCEGLALMIVNNGLDPKIYVQGSGP